MIARSTIIEWLAVAILLGIIGTMIVFTVSVAITLAIAKILAFVFYWAWIGAKYCFIVALLLLIAIRFKRWIHKH
jgi:hypothetical protein